MMVKLGKKYRMIICERAGLEGYEQGDIYEVIPYEIKEGDVLFECVTDISNTEGSLVGCDDLSLSLRCFLNGYELVEPFPMENV